MTVFEQQNLKDLRQAGYVQITNGEAAQALIIFIQQNFSHEFPYGLKLIPEIVQIFKTDTQGHLEFHQTQLQKLTLALETLR
jgi:hypothetical protein